MTLGADKIAFMVDKVLDSSVQLKAPTKLIIFLMQWMVVSFGMWIPYFMKAAHPLLEILSAQ